MLQHTVTSADGTRLRVDETGDTSARPIIFIHGFSQSRLSWAKQMESDLADDFRLIAYDLRGHGMSDVPAGGYTDSKAWADDLRTVIDELELDGAVPIGWSYGPLVILDYIRHHGEAKLGGFGMIGGVSKLGSDEAMSVLGQEFVALVPGFFSENPEEAKQSLGELINICFAPPPSGQEFAAMLEHSTAVPFFVRQGMFSRSFDNDDLLPRLKKPVLITHGTADRVVKPVAAEYHASAIPNAELHIVEGSGHAPFWDDPSAYNARLRSFCNSLDSAESVKSAA
jgi:pimeloyl-ACP methyl ester carboxylesterase